jgi:hypothetical protein
MTVDCSLFQIDVLLSQAKFKDLKDLANYEAG